MTARIVAMKSKKSTGPTRRAAARRAGRVVGTSHAAVGVLGGVRLDQRRQRPGPPGGPCDQWTRMVRGKTERVALSREQQTVLWSHLQSDLE